MNAAVVTSFDQPPRWQSFAKPEPKPGEFLADVLAVGLHPRVRSAANGSHYTSTGTLPMIPGIDGVGRNAEGKRFYFVADDDRIGTMAEKAAVDPRRAILLPEHVDAATIAAAMNPAMSSWVALRRRVPIQKGQSVLVLGASGNAGAMAVEVAKRLGAGQVIGAGRNLERLHAVKQADAVVPLADVAAAADVDIVLDYLWGEPAQNAIMALLQARKGRSRELNWIQIGAVAGATLTLPSVILRSANFRIQGTGQGAVSRQAYLAELPALVEEIAAGTFAIKARPRPFKDVETIWREPDVPGERIVLTP